jgi:glycyl-tRNA synthetase beta chain
MTNNNDLLIEIGTEELPPKNLKKLMTGFAENFRSALQNANFEFTEVTAFATPRRLALVVKQLANTQPTQEVERRGPALKAAIDDNGEPTKAAQGFMRSCGVASLDELEHLETEKGTWLVHRDSKPGATLEAMLGDLLQQALKDLPIERRMRWGSSRFEFVRPVHWLVALYGTETIKCELFGITAARLSQGHRFMSEGECEISSVDQYLQTLKAHHVVADFNERQQLISKQLTDIAAQEQADVEIDEDLLDEVTALVEWPVALTGSFPNEFLKVPEEALVSAMKEHQRYFHMTDKHGKMLPKFITISNIESSNPDTVVSGNEKVILPRLSDARFFLEQDQKSSLEEKRTRLANVVFQSELGTYLNKAERIEALAGELADLLGANKATAEKAARLCKSDLVSDMVDEFPDLQGVMGGYYASYAGEPNEVCEAIAQHYLPNASGGSLPNSLESKCVAIADKLDTLVGMFGIGQPPSGSKDPFALRRQTLGILRMCIEGQLDISLDQLFDIAIRAHNKTIDPQPLKAYAIERLKNWYQEQGLRFDTVDAVVSTPDWSGNLYRSHLTIQALESFRDSEQATALIAANKRVANILKKQGNDVTADIDPGRFTETEEQVLFDAVKKMQVDLTKLNEDTEKLALLGTLRDQVDQYFDKVMVMADDESIRTNRIASLGALRGLFLQVADISLLQQ